jgi:hypothetical protein
MYCVSKRSIVIEFSLLVSVFLFSLGSHYFYQIGLYAFQLAGILLALPFFKLDKLSWSKARLFSVVIFFLYFFIHGILLASFSGNDIFGVSKLILPLFVFFYFSFAVVMFYIYPHVFQRVLYGVIAIHVAFFIFQFSWFLITSDVIDFLVPFTGESQRVVGGSYTLSYLSAFVRPSGLFNEPGTYSTWMILLLLLLKSNANRIGFNSKNSILEIFVIGTVLFSFSTFGFIFTIIYFRKKT